MPRTEITARLARKLAPRNAAAGIRIALAGPHGQVEGVRGGRDERSAARFAEPMKRYGGPSTTGE
jgi:hypothetical protein